MKSGVSMFVVLILLYLSIQFVSAGTLCNYFGIYCDNDLDQIKVDIVYPDNQLFNDCKKVCKNIGTRSEGFYNSCTEELIEYTQCGSENENNLIVIIILIFIGIVIVLASIFLLIRGWRKRLRVKVENLSNVK